jgi:unconventional prefoldin RPB5 interactor 1
MADTLVERPVKKKPAAAPSDDSDRILQRRELAAEYYRRRNEIIRQQGGFKANADEDEEQGELMEERDGKVKKVSRFRAARIK